MFSELVRYWHRFGPFCISSHAITKRSEMPQYMSFRSNGVDVVRSFLKILKQLRLANLCINGTYSASFATTFMQLQDGRKCPKT
jgi:hypothetical protein